MLPQRRGPAEALTVPTRAAALAGGEQPRRWPTCCGQLTAALWSSAPTRCRTRSRHSPGCHASRFAYPRRSPAAVLLRACSPASLLAS